MGTIPTRMELSKLKKRLKASKEGHKLLKEKQDELMRTFIASLNEAKKLRSMVNQSVQQLSMEAGLAAAAFSPQMIQNAFLAKDSLVYADIRSVKWMGVSLVDISYDVRSSRKASALISSPQLIRTAQDMQSFLPHLLNLAISEKNCSLLAAEIEMLRRRVNALEHRIIPDLETNIRAITMKLSDNERETISRLIKIKSMD